MDWQDEGVVLGLIKHGESAVILEAFTRAHGRHKGYVHGGASRSKRGLLQPGNVLALSWRGRLADSLGQFSVEPKSAYAAAIMAGEGPLAALRSLAAMLSRSLPEHDPHPALYDRFLGLLADLAAAGDGPAWGISLARFERDLLADLGYGLDLTECAVTGRREGLAFVSPKTGRAVTAEGAGEYRDRLLPLPAFLTDKEAEADWREVADALALTRHFLERFFAEADHKPLPEERHRLTALIGEKAARYGGTDHH